MTQALGPASYATLATAAANWAMWRVSERLEWEIASDGLMAQLSPSGSQSQCWTSMPADRRVSWDCYSQRRLGIKSVSGLCVNQELAILHRKVGAATQKGFAPA